MSVEAANTFIARVKPADISEILQTLYTMGHAHRGKTKGTFLA